MELAVREARARLSELIAAAQKGERVVITKHGIPAVEMVRCHPRGAIDFEKLEETRRKLGIEGDGERWPSEFDDPACSRRVLGLEPEDGQILRAAAPAATAQSPAAPRSPESSSAEDSLRGGHST